jgi:RNA polymerase sigma factor (sigma-70 family)
MVDVTAGTADTGLAENELGDLYAALAERLRQIVGGQVHASDALIEDSCQVAWSRLIRHHARVRRETALGWLATTALHEAFRLLRPQRREIPLEKLVDSADTTGPLAPVSSLEELVEHRERLRTIERLPERQQRLLWLQGLGLSYTEMARYTGATPRTVERQLLRAKRALRAAA